jgi:hypothetical protein
MPGARPAWRHAACLASLWLSLASSAQADGYSNALAGKTPSRSAGVRRPEALVDGRAARAGAYWKTKLSCVFADRGSSVEFDLGALHRFSAARLSADANDSYALELSRDGREFALLWEARAVRRGRGMQVRSASALDAEGRYVRVRPSGGDGWLAISELELFTGSGAELPVLRTSTAPELDGRMRDRTLQFGVFLIACLVLAVRGKRALLAAAVAAGLWGCFQLAVGVWNAWPVDARGMALLRGTIAVVGASAIAREAFAPPRWPAQRAVNSAVLGLCALLAPLAFYNLGHPQFYNQHQGRWSFAHYLDLRQYYPTAKYFPELGYARLYEADLAALAESRPDGIDGLEKQELRDLRSFAVVRAGQREREIAAARARFSSERFAEYRRDAGWFRAAMGDAEYLETLLDFGGNATPTWMAIAHVLFSLVPPSASAFEAMALIDLLLLLAAFVAIQRVFGWRTLLVCLLVFGANDFVMYGTNWSGATLRHDWLAYLALGACALRSERWVAAGALLALSAMIRAFPALALAGAALPALWRLSTQLARTRTPPRFAALYASERAILRVALGAGLMVLATGLLSTWLLGLGAWVEWFHKVALLETDPHPASVALRNLIAGSDFDQARILRARWPLHAAAVAFYVGAVVIAARNARPDQAMVLALCLVPVVFYPANYYLHLVFLLPLLANGRPAPESGSESASAHLRDATLWLLVLGLCAAQYFTTLTEDTALHFYLSTALLLATLAALLGVVLWHDRHVRCWLGLARR